ncbi:nucleoside deaminase [Streptomyces cinnamoneus]|uniref:nucleoside deaminase n=1 Tax=Streptomyces cinnamoneus TaxID=53446 RepID=UPI0033D69160
MTSLTPSRRSFLTITAAGAAAAAAPLPLAPAVSADTGWTGDWPPRLRAAVRRAMPAAVEYARSSVKWPFGAVLVDAATGAVGPGAGNTTESGDPTGHAETNLVRLAAADGIALSGHVVVTTAEPCAMCAGALLWGGVRGIAYGTSVAKLIAWGMPQIDVSVDELIRRTRGLRHPALAREVRAGLTDPLYRT